jgi:hypothetical protein
MGAKRDLQLLLDEKQFANENLTHRDVGHQVEGNVEDDLQRYERKRKPPVVRYKRDRRFFQRCS